MWPQKLSDITIRRAANRALRISLVQMRWASIFHENNGSSIKHKNHRNFVEDTSERNCYNLNATRSWSISRNGKMCLNLDLFFEKYKVWTIDRSIHELLITDKLRESSTFSTNYWKLLNICRLSHVMAFERKHNSLFNPYWLMAL